jgi:hypothetical protein
VGRWLGRIDSGSLHGLSSYLKEAQQFAESSAHIIMAMDLEDVVPLELIKQRLSESETLAGKQVDVDTIAKVLSSIRGVTLGITAADQRNGSIKVDFRENVAPIRDFAKPLLLEALANNGAMINEFEEWEVHVAERQVRLQGRFEQSGMQRLMSLLDVPPALQQAAATSDQNNQQQEEQRVVLASQQYFKSIRSLLDDLRNDKKNVKTMGSIGTWFGTYARRIDRLPILNVDPELVDYGKFVSQSLRGGQTQVTTAAARSRIGQQQVPQQYDVNTYYQPVGANLGGAYGWYGWSAQANVRATEQAKARVRTQEKIQGSMSANLVLQQIDDATNNIRVGLTQKYNAEF